MKQTNLLNITKQITSTIVILTTLISCSEPLVVSKTIPTSRNEKESSQPIRRMAENHTIFLQRLKCIAHNKPKNTIIVTDFVKPIDTLRK
jgi:hypothetical protein